MTIALLVAGGVVALVGAVYLRIWWNAGPCEGPGCKGRAWFWHEESQRGMCGDCCWLHEMDSLDMGPPRAARKGAR